jgi:hypothetical protein
MREGEVKLWERAIGLRRRRHDEFRRRSKGARRRWNRVKEETAGDVAL